MARWLGVAAGLCAIASALAIFGFLVSEDAAVAASNLLIIPAALVLGVSLAGRRPTLALASTAAGIAASLMWAPNFRFAAAEVWWIGLATLWWAGIGWLLLPRHRATGRLTLFLAFAAAVDLVVTGANVGQPLFALGGLKIPLTAFWSGWIGVLLIRDRELGTPSLSDLTSSSAAVVGGVVWMLGGTGWLLTHGISGNPSAENLFGLRGTEYTQLLVVAGLMWLLALIGNRLGRFGWLVACVGVAMVTLGAFMETSFVNPDTSFFHPLVQGGWLLFVGGLAFTAVGMFALGLTTDDSRLRLPYLLIGVLAPLPVAAFVFGGINDEGFVAVLLLAFLHAAPGFGFAALGLVLRAGASANQPGRQT